MIIYILFYVPKKFGDELIEEIYDWNVFDLPKFALNRNPVFNVTIPQANLVYRCFSRRFNKFSLIFKKYKRLTLCESLFICTNFI
jgi:hypothetical protein